MQQLYMIICICRIQGEILAYGGLRRHDGGAAAGGAARSERAHRVDGGAASWGEGWPSASRGGREQRREMTGGCQLGARLGRGRVRGRSRVCGLEKTERNEVWGEVDDVIRPSPNANLFGDVKKLYLHKKCILHLQKRDNTSR
jgi:hypothetical protein